MAALLLTSMVWSGHAQEKNEMDLSGEWAFQTDVMDFRRGSLDVRYCHRLQESIVLPGITDDYKIGYKSPYRHLDRLTRVYEYMGPAWYQREIEIPAAWKGKRIFLYFERTHWLSSVYVGKEEVSKIDYISIPHNHELTQWLHPGKKELITFCIDNRYQYDTHKWDHAHSEFTQINWNGVLGEIKLVAVDPVYVDDMQVYPDIKNKSIKVKMTVRNCTEHTASGKISFHVSGKDYRLQKEVPVTVTDSITYIEEEMFLSKDIHLWNEFHPNLYTLDCKLTSSVEGQSYAHEKSTTFGMREVEAGEDHIILNGEPIHLRGTVENAVFPKTGYAPVDDASWERVLRILKEYGMNHMRFHSWCPPAAAFRMADKLGVYLEVEMPMWGKDAQPDEKRWNFFRRELRGILKEYGNHPSFILYCNGNEITGDFSFIEELTATARQLDNRRLYSGSTARTRVKSDQFYITHQTTKGHMAIYEGRPYTNWDKNKELGVGLPIISHESGQRCIYPNFEEIKNFTGPVQARNFEIFRELLDKNHMLDQAHDFFRASGALTAIEYKDVIEAQLRTYLKGGFQLLSLNDFTGQGYGVVIMCHSIGQEGRVGINVGRLVGQNKDCLVDKVVHILFKRNVIKECFFGPVDARITSLVVYDGHGVGKQVIENPQGFLRESCRPFASLTLYTAQEWHPFYFIKIVVHFFVIGQHTSYASFSSIGGDTIVDTVIHGHGVCHFLRQPSFQVNVIVYNWEIVLL